MTFRFALLLTMGLVLGFTSCKDSGKKLLVEEPEQLAEQDIDQAAEFWNVVGQLTDDVMPDVGWQTAQYRPSIGEPEGGNTAIRVVECADIESAAASFADLIGLSAVGGFAADTKEYTYHNDLIGTLTWHQAGGETLATVDVDIKQMPGLQRIVYRTVTVNGSFSGTAYYRFGDVVSKRNTDGNTDYWICVRPCFGLEGKGDSHWISLSKIPAENVKTVNKTVSGQHLTHLMPKCLATNQEHMQNLAELLYAMLNPDQWAANLKTNNGYKTLKYFKDFHYEKNYKYHDATFFRNVAKGWGADLFLPIFGLSGDQLRAELDQYGLNLVYSSATMSSNDISLPVTSFTGTNLKTKTLFKKTSRWDTRNFNIYDLTAKGYIDDPGITSYKNKLWLVRYATGATLAKGSQESPVFDKYKKLPNCTDVFVYNRNVDHLDMTVEGLKNTPPKVATDVTGTLATNAKTNGTGYYLQGDVVEDQYGNRWFCILGSPWFEPYGSMFTDHYARFISFDFRDVNTTGNTVAGLPTEAELPEFASQLMTFVNDQGDGFNYSGAVGGPLGKCLQHIYEYTGLNLDQWWVLADSTFRFKRENTFYDSQSKSYLFNIAYNDGTQDRQPIARLLYDMTQAGSARTNCISPQGKKFQDVHLRCYKHYETYDLSRMRPLTADEDSLGMNTWCLPWAMTQDKIYLQDVADQAIVNRHAADDKWVTLPLFLGENMTGPRRRPRTSAVNSVKPSDCIGRVNTYGMFNEPVWFIRTMKVLDNGGPTLMPNLVSEDGRRLTVVHLRNDPEDYRSDKQAKWAIPYSATSKTLFELDNQLFPLPAIAGWIE